MDGYAFNPIILQDHELDRAIQKWRAERIKAENILRRLMVEKRRREDTQQRLF